MENSNPLNLSVQYFKELRKQYLNDEELMHLCDKDDIYNEKFNEKKNFEIKVFNDNACFGDIELYLNCKYLNTCVVCSDKAILLDIKKKDVTNIFRKEKDIYDNFYKSVMKKIIFQIKRLYYLKQNYIELIKTKFQNNFYNNIIQPNFFDQLKNNNSSSYYTQKKELKKLYPHVFKYAHFDPPIIYDSIWAEREKEHEKNNIFLYRDNFLTKKNSSTKIENHKSKANDLYSILDINIKNIYNLKVFRNNRILEEQSTTKTNNATISNNNLKSSCKVDDIFNNNDIIENNIIRSKSQIFEKKTQSNNIVISGVHKLNILNLAKRFSNFFLKQPNNNLNIVKNSDKSILLSPAHDFNYSPKTFKGSTLPPIKKTKKKIHLPYEEKRTKLSTDQKNETNIDTYITLNVNKVRDNLNENEKQKKEISQYVKNFYTKQKNGGYLSYINIKHNKFCKKIKSKSVKKV
jgi:hypothetical protein